MALQDKELEKELLEIILMLERKLDWIAETPLRRNLSEKIVDMRMQLIRFEEKEI